MTNNYNIYYDPEKFELTIFGHLSESLSYEFNYFVIFKHTDGRLFYAHDSGCSCPAPFEDFKGISELTPITLDTFDRFETELRNWRPVNMPVNEVIGMISKVNLFLRTGVRK